MREPAAEPGRRPLLTLAGVGKRYPGVIALDGIDLTLHAGETIGLVGENGAGKSTLLDIVSGNRRPDSGALTLAGRPLAMASPDDARRAGIFRVYQEQSLIGAYPVMQNLFLGAEQHFTRWGLLDYRAMRKAARQVLGDLGIDIDPDVRTASLNFGTRQLVELARMVALATLGGVTDPIVLLDEPTSSLSRSDLARFFAIVERLKTGFRASLVFISHRMEEVLALSDRLIVLKDGRLVGTSPPDVDTGTLHRLMVGRERASDFYATGLQRRELGEPVLQLDRLSGSAFSDVTLSVREGEILGIGGLVQSGKAELGLAIFGAEPSRGGIALCGRAAERLGIAERIACGAGYVPLNRHHDGILLGRSIRDNIGLPGLAEGRAFGLVDRAARDAAADRALAEMGIKAPGTASLARHLSGGNQQKVVLAKWLRRGPKLLVLDNPTRGVDAGAKEEIYRLIRAAASGGCGILLISDDLVELIELSNRIAFMRGGTLSAAVAAPPEAKPAEHDVIPLMV